MRTKPVSRNRTRRKDTSRRNFLRVEHLEDRMVLSGVSPMAVNDLYDAIMDEPLEIGSPGILANDTNAVSASLFTGPEHGSVTLAEDGSFVYTPEAGYLGMDSFTYTASDGAST